MIGQQVGNFRIVSLLGKGGMGEVYLGEHELGSRVAIKVLLPHVSANEALVQRFFNEAIAVGKIQHAGIGKIFDSGTHAGRAYLVMELLPGETLATRLRRVGRLSLAEVGELGKQIAGVLEAVHNAGITHRDLKPDNIFVVPDDELGERIKIVDFGIAKLTGVGGGMTATTASALGTPAYMSPEQWKNAKHVDWRADAYSLGCLAFEMIAGRPPFIAETIGEACAKHLTEDAPRVSSIVEVPAELDALIASLLEKLPDQRPSSLRAIAKAFAAIGEMSSTELPVMQAMAPDALPVAGQGATQVSMMIPSVPHPQLSATTLGSASGQLPAAPRKRSVATWIAVGLGAALVATIAWFVIVVMTRSEDRVDQAAVAETPIVKPPEKPVELPKRPPEKPVELPLQTAGSGTKAATPRAIETPTRRTRPTAQKPMFRIETVPTGATIKLEDAVTKQLTVLGESPINLPTMAPGKYRVIARFRGVVMDEEIEVAPNVPFFKKLTFRSLSPLPDILDPRLIQSAVMQQVGEIRQCASQPGGAFMPTIEVTVSPQGTVLKTREIQVPSTPRGVCLISVIRGVAFPLSKNGGFGRVLFPMTPVAK